MSFPINILSSYPFFKVPEKPGKNAALQNGSLRRAPGHSPPEYILVKSKGVPSFHLGRDMSQFAEQGGTGLKKQHVFYPWTHGLKGRF